MGQDPLLIELDNRRRAPLGKLGRPEDHRYLATSDASGRILLEPAVVMTETERAVLQDSEFWIRVNSALDEPLSPFDLDGMD